MIGLGSMGKRRVRNLKKNGESEIFGFDNRKDRAEEARKLYTHRNLNALQTVGYKELFDHFEGNVSLEQAIEKIKQHTRNFAKRQVTWFKSDPDINWISIDEDKDPAITIINHIRDKAH